MAKIAQSKSSRCARTRLLELTWSLCAANGSALSCAARRRQRYAQRQTSYAARRHLATTGEHRWAASAACACWTALARPASGPDALPLERTSDFRTFENVNIGIREQLPRLVAEAGIQRMEHQAKELPVAHHHGTLTPRLGDRLNGRPPPLENFARGFSAGKGVRRLFERTPHDLTPTVEWPRCDAPLHETPMRLDGQSSEAVNGSIVARALGYGLETTRSTTVAEKLCQLLGLDETPRPERRVRGWTRTIRHAAEAAPAARVLPLSGRPRIPAQRPAARVAAQYRPAGGREASTPPAARRPRSSHAPMRSRSVAAGCWTALASCDGRDVGGMPRSRAPRTIEAKR